MRKSREVLAFFIVLLILSITPGYAEENSDFEIKRLEIDVDIDAGGISLVKEDMDLVNTSSEKIHSIEMDISGDRVWNVRAFEDEDKILPTHTIQKDNLTYKIKIYVDIKPGETKSIWLQYLLDRGIISEKFEDFQYVSIIYNFLESKYLGAGNYPLSIGFWAPKGFFMTIDAGDYISEYIGINFIEKHRTYQERDYISLVFEKKPKQKSIMVILRNKEKIDKFSTRLEETIDFAGSTPIMKIIADPVACIRLNRLFTIPLPYKGENCKLYPENVFEFKSNNSYSWLAPKDYIVHFRVGYPLWYNIEYNINDINFENPFFTIINREISETREYTLTLFLKEKPYFIYNTPLMRHIGNAYIMGFWNESEEKYEIWIYDYRDTYLEPINYTIAFMTEDQFLFNLIVFLVLSIVSLLLAWKGDFIKLNKDFSTYIFIFFVSLLIIVFLILPVFNNFQSLNIISYSLMLIITFLIFFLYLFFSKNLSFEFGFISGIVFLFINHGALLSQLAREVYYFALRRDVTGELILSTAGSILAILYYLYKGKEIQETVWFLYQKTKIQRFTIPIVILSFIIVPIIYLSSISPFMTRLGVSILHFCIFIFLSGFAFFSAVKNPRYRKENGYFLYKGIVTKIEKQENESVCFHLQYWCSDNDDNKGVFSEKESTFVYDNKISYPIFGLSYSQIKEKMELIVVTRNVENVNGSLPIKAWIITSS